MLSKTFKSSLAACLTFTALGAATHAVAGTELFVESARQNADGTVTLPMYRGTSGGQTVWFVILDTSDGKDAARLRVNQASKLTNAKGTAAVQKVTLVNGAIDFPATVNFAPTRRVVPGPQGFPPAVAEPGDVGMPGYSPLIQMPNGTVRNAPHVANNSGRMEKAVSIDFVARRITLPQVDGFANGKRVKYISTDASDPGAAALENATYAPALNAAPFAGGDGSDSSRATLVAFVNGQTGANNPQRQGLNSALLDGLDPLNVVAWTPNQGRYSPLWDVFPAMWSAQAAATGQNLRQDDTGDIENLADKGLISGPGGAPFGPGGFIVNCPVISEED
jgi:hypothetical protein